MNIDHGKRFPTPESLRDYLYEVAGESMDAEYIWPIGDCFVTTEMRKEIMTSQKGPYVVGSGTRYEIMFIDKKGGVWQVSLQKLGRPKVSTEYIPTAKK